MTALRQSTQESVPLSRMLKNKTNLIENHSIISLFSVMADLLDAVVDIHDKLHMDVIFNPSRDSSSSSVTVQSKFMVISIIKYSHNACFGKFHYYFLYDHFSKKNQFLFLMCLSDLRRHFGK